MKVLMGTGMKGMRFGEVHGEALVSTEPISFLGDVDPLTGRVHRKGHVLEGKSLKDKILVFPTGAGSTAGSYVLLTLAKHGNAPKAIVNTETDSVTLVGAIIAKIPVVHKLDKDPMKHIKTGDKLTVVPEEGIIRVGEK